MIDPYLAHNFLLTAVIGLLTEKSELQFLIKFYLQHLLGFLVSLGLGGLNTSICHGDTRRRESRSRMHIKLVVILSETFSQPLRLSGTRVGLRGEEPR